MGRMQLTGNGNGRMETSERGEGSQLTLEEQRFRLEKRRLDLDHSFARKWLPTMVGVIAGMFGYVQQQASIEETKRAGIEVKVKDEREWGFKVIEMYFSNRELFDLTKNPEAAALNLRVLAAVAPARSARCTECGAIKDSAAK